MPDSYVLLGSVERHQSSHLDEHDVAIEEELLDPLHTTNDVMQFFPLLGTGDDNSNSNNNANADIGSNEDGESQYHTSLRAGDGDNAETDNGSKEDGHGDNNNQGGNDQQTHYASNTHEKTSQEKDYAPPTPPPTPPPTLADIDPNPENYMSLKALHNGDPKSLLEFNSNLSAENIHYKFSMEKNGKNPKMLPLAWMPPAPTPSPTEDTDAVSRVNPAPSTEEDDGKRDCKSNNNGAYGDDRQSSKNGGVVLRYQYELEQDLSYLDSDLTEDILPLLEEAISDWLLPVFFPDECRKLSTVKRRLQQDGLRGGIRGLQSVNVVGLSGEPADFPLEQSKCQFEYIPLSLDLQHQCHVMEGALTLYFPPNRPASTLLSATTLETLKSIHQGMKDGSLAKMAHPAILQLVFLESSYSLMPILPMDWENDQVVQVKGEKGGGNGAAIAIGIIIPLLLLCCCAGGFFWWKRQQDDADDDVREKDANELSDEDENQKDDDDSEDKIQEKMLMWSKFRQRQKKSSRDIAAAAAIGNDPVKAEKAEKRKKRKKSRRRKHDKDRSVESESIESSSIESSAGTEESRSIELEQSLRSSSGADTNPSSDDTDTDTDTDDTEGDNTTTSDDSSTEGSTTTDGSTTSSQSSTTSGTGSQSKSFDNTTTSSSGSSSSSDSDSDSSEEYDAVSGIFPTKYFHGDSGFDLAKDLEALKGPPGAGATPYTKKRRKKKKGPAINNNIFMTGGVDDSSVATGATGMFSQTSESTARVSNVLPTRIFTSAGGGDSVATGATERVSNVVPGRGAVRGQSQLSLF